MNYKYPKSHGVVMIDIILALSLSALFIVIISDVSSVARFTFEKSRQKSNLLDSFRIGEFEVYPKPFGNELIEEEISTSSDISVDMLFTRISLQPHSSLTEFTGTSLCSTNYSNKEIVGSYQYIFDKDYPDYFPKVKQIMFPIDPLLPLTDIEVRNNRIYLSADSSLASDPDLLVFDVSSEDFPVLISQINTGPGISSITIAGKRIFAAAASSVAQLHVIRFDTLENPTIENKYKLPPPYATATPPFGSAIYYNSGFVYIGTEKWDGQEFNIIDVVDPANPRKIGGFEVGSKVNDILVRNGRAYLATADIKQLIILDISDQRNPTLIQGISPSGWQRQEGKSLSIFEDSLSFGRTSGGFNMINDHELFNWASSSQIGFDEPYSIDFSGGIYGIVSDRFRTFSVTRKISSEFQIFDRYLNASSSASVSLPILPKTMTCYGDAIYILANTAPVVYKITF